jgi:hypothetical protein
MPNRPSNSQSNLLKDDDRRLQRSSLSSSFTTLLCSRISESYPALPYLTPPTITPVILRFSATEKRPFDNENSFRRMKWMTTGIKNNDKNKERRQNTIAFYHDAAHCPRKSRAGSHRSNFRFTSECWPARLEHRLDVGREAIALFMRKTKTQSAEREFILTCNLPVTCGR